MKNVIVFLSLIAILICMNLDFGIGFGADDSDVFDKRASDEEMDFEFTSKRKQHGESSPHLQQKRQSLSKEHRSSNRLTARRVRDKLVQRDRMRSESKSFLQGLLALRRTQLGTSDADVEQKRSMTSQLERSPTLSYKRAAALHAIRALEERAADRLHKQRAMDESSDRLLARGARLRAVEARVASVRSLFGTQERYAEYEMHGSFVYEATFNTTVTWCRSTCDKLERMCASFLYIVRNGICVFHYDIE